MVMSWKCVKLQSWPFLLWRRPYFSHWARRHWPSTRAASAAGGRRRPQSRPWWRWGQCRARRSTKNSPPVAWRGRGGQLGNYAGQQLGGGSGGGGAAGKGPFSTLIVTKTNFTSLFFRGIAGKWEFWPPPSQQSALKILRAVGWKNWHMNIQHKQC